jgi:hypothetical protein
METGFRCGKIALFATLTEKMETGVIFSCRASSSRLSLVSAQGGGTCLSR